MTIQYPDGSAICEKCNKRTNTTILRPKVWNSWMQDYLEAFVCDDCMVKWGPLPVQVKNDESNGKTVNPPHL